MEWTIDRFAVDGESEVSVVSLLPIDCNQVGLRIVYRCQSQGTSFRLGVHLTFLLNCCCMFVRGTSIFIPRHRY